MQNTR